MSQFSPPNYNNEGRGLDVYKKDTSFEVSPFQVMVTKFNSMTNGTVEAKVTKYSGLLPSLNVVDTLPIIGLDWQFEIKYGFKIYLEVYYDQNLNPICPNIRYAPKWPSKTINPSDNKEILTYPNSIEFITRKDLEAKGKELRDQRATNDSILQALQDDIDGQLRLGIIPQEYATAYKAKLVADYGKVRLDLDRLIADMPKFFTGSALTKKQFKSFTLLAYTTKDRNSELSGRMVRPPNIVTPTTGLTQSVKDGAFKIVQCTSTDLILVDSAYNNVWPCKIPFPFTRPVYHFDIEGVSEEKTNTK